MHPTSYSSLPHLPKMHNGPSPKLETRFSNPNEREISKILNSPNPLQP
jgi:hypothetical protein